MWSVVKSAGIVIGMTVEGGDESEALCDHVVRPRKGGGSAMENRIDFTPLDG